MDVQVLIVDDEQQVLKALSRTMRQAKFSFVAVASGEDALEWLSHHHADVVLSDYRMPGMRGTDLLAKVAVSWPETVRIILSGQADFKTVLAAVHSGAVHKFLAKPWSNQELVEHIDAALAQLGKSSVSLPACSLSSSPNSSDIPLQIILDTVVDGIVTIDQQGVILSVNTAVEAIFGHTPQELIGRNVSVLMPEPYRSQHNHYLAQFSHPGNKGILGNQRRLVGLRKNGEVFPIELTVREMEIQGERQFLGMIRDISRRVSAESENELLIGALEIAQDGFALFGASDRLLRFNKQFKQLYSQFGVEVEANTSYEVFFRRCIKKGLFVEAQANPFDWIEQQLALHQKLPVVKEYELKPGVWIEIHESRAENGATIVSHLDISPLKQTQHSLEIAVEEANQANSARGRFLAMMSHEIRTPLNGVLGLLQLLQETPLNKDQFEYVDNAIASGEGLLTIISDILDFSKIEANKLELSDVPCNLRALMKQLTQLLSMRVEEKSIALKVEVDPIVPDWILIDQQRLRQVLLNLLGNAIKFTDYGSVSVSLKQQDGLFFTVEDTGIGIPEFEQSKIFSEFTTISNTREGQLHAGTGLGLAISHRLVRLMGGDLGFTSEKNKGTQFWFRLPLRETSAPEAADKLMTTTRLKGTVLVVDDSATNRLVAKHMLTSFGVEVVTAEDGMQALSLASAKLFNLILLDISMPGIDGYQTLNELRSDEKSREIPVVAFTAYVMSEDKLRFKAAGFDAHLEKPLDKTQLYQVIAPYLESDAIEIAAAQTEKVVPAVATEYELIDKRKLDQLAKDTSEEDLLPLAQVFIEDAQKRLQQLKSESAEPQLVERNLHTLASSAALYGLMPFSASARALEREYQNAQTASEKLPDFIRLAEQSLSALQLYLEERLNQP